jgi:adenosine deaminase
VSLLDDEEVLALVLENEVTLEACITSNVQTGVIENAADHPLAQWLERGVRATICTDNTLMSRTDLPGEYARAAEIPGMTPALLDRARQCGVEAAFGAHARSGAEMVSDPSP